MAEKLNGVYALEIHMDKDVKVKVGALGEIAFKEGTYVYVGSAQRNLEKRMQRHLRKQKRLFWHIDYLLNDDHAKIAKALLKEAGKTEECTIAQKLKIHGEPVAGFGCSDCQCQSHLLWFPAGFSTVQLGAFAAADGWHVFEA